MPDSDQKMLAPPDGHPLLDKPAEEKLRDEIEDLKRQLEEERKKSQKKDEHQPQKPRSGTLRLLGIGLVVVILLAFFLGWLPRHRREQRIAEEAREEEQALPVLTAVQAKRSSKNSELMLPGNIEAITEAPIVARSEGYIRKRYVDIGDRVRKGQLLAEIEAPDLDQQVQQGRAQLAQTLAAEKQAISNLEQGKANEALAQVSATRWANLFKRGAVARQEYDQYQTQYQAAVANVGALNQAVSAAHENVSASQANLRRLEELQSFEKPRAPFDGVVTFRNTDVGAYIANGTTLLYRIAQIDRLRTYIYVPQANAGSIQLNQPAQLQALEFPNRNFRGIVTRTAKALDPANRTMLTEVQVPNSDGALLPGMYVQVNLNNVRPQPPILIPGDALMIRSNGSLVAVAREPDPQTRDQLRQEMQKQDELDRKRQQRDEKGQSKKGSEKAQDKNAPSQQNQNQPKQNQPGQNQQTQNKNRDVRVIHLQPVRVGRDYGNEVEVSNGLNLGELVIINPNDDAREGARVIVQVSNQDPDAETKGLGGGKSPSVSGEKLAPQHGAEPAPKNPSKEKKTRGPGY